MEHRYSGGPTGAYGHAYGPYDATGVGEDADDAHLDPGAHQDDDEADDSTVNVKHGGGRPRDRIWSYFTDEPRCKYCNWKPDFPKAFRMRNHAMACNDTPQEIKDEIQSDLDERARRQQERAQENRLKPPKKRKRPESQKAPDELLSPKQQVALATLHTGVAPVAGPSSAPHDANNAYHAGQPDDAGQLNRSYHPGQTGPPPQQPPPPSIVSPQSSNPYSARHFLSPYAHPHPPPAPVPMARSPITCHVLDSTAGRPAIDMRVRLDMLDSTGFNLIGQGETDNDGRCTTLLEPGTKLQHGIFKITFYTSEYFTKKGILSFYPFVEIPFEIKTPEEHFHIPLLLSPYSYTTYRGS